MRSRSNFVRGTVDDNPLGSGATTLTSTELADLPAIVAPDIAVLVLDPAGAAPEIVHVTAHTASATTATILRAQEGTSAAVWVLGTTWRHTPTAADFGSLAGQVGGPPIQVLKTANESVTSSATLQDDNELLLPGVANAEYGIELTLFVQGATGGDLKLGVEAPAGSTILYGGSGSDIAATTTLAQQHTAAFSEAGGSVTGTNFGTVGAATVTIVRVVAFVQMGATPGNIKLVWAQRVSSGTATTILAGSFMVGRRLGE